MGLQAIRVDNDPAQRLLHRHDLGSDVRRALISAKGNGSPLALIVREEEASAFDACADLIVHKFKKPAKALGPLALGQKQIPLVRGEYKSGGKLEQSVRTLLLRAGERGDKNVYLIVANTETFAELWSRTVVLKVAGSPDRQAARSSAEVGEPTAAADVQVMIDLLGDRPIPEALVKEFIGDAAEVRLVRHLIVRAAESDDPVLIHGDSGTGKEVVARLIHTLSVRREGTFMAVNCGAIPRDLFEAELFGFEKGSHNMAFFRKSGLWKVAHRGTLFLDEIADLALDHQVKLLRALDTGEIRPLGSEKNVQVDARVLAATNRDLFAMVQAGQFREDLYYRLRAMFIPTPSLRAHTADIPALAQDLWKGTTHDPASALSPDVLQVLRDHPWPGNVRELKACLATAYNLFRTKEIRVEHLRAVFGIERLHVGGDRPSVALENVSVFRLQCLRHLRQATEVLRAAQVPLRDVMKGRKRTPENFRSIGTLTEDRVNELEVLCSHLDLFHSYLMFSKVRRLKEKLRYFTEVLRDDPEAALAYWRSELEPEFQDVLTALFEEMEKVVKGT